MLDFTKNKDNNNQMKTLKVMSVIGIVWFAAHLLLVNMPSNIALQGPESTADFLQSCYALAFSIVVLVQAKKACKKQ